MVCPWGLWSCHIVGASWGLLAFYLPHLLKFPFSLRFQLKSSVRSSTRAGLFVLWNQSPLVFSIAVFGDCILWAACLSFSDSHVGCEPHENIFMLPRFLHAAWQNQIIFGWKIKEIIHLITYPALLPLPFPWCIRCCAESRVYYVLFWDYFCSLMLTSLGTTRWIKVQMH